MSEITGEVGDKPCASETFGISQREMPYSHARLHSAARVHQSQLSEVFGAWFRQKLRRIRTLRVQTVGGRRSHRTADGGGEPLPPPCPLRLASVLWHKVYLPSYRGYNFSQVTIFLLIFFLIFSPGCTIWRPFRFEGKPPELPEFYRNYYEYPRLEQPTRILAEEKAESYRLKKVEIPLHLPPELTVKNLDEFQKEVEELAKTDQKTASDRRLQYTNRIDFYLPGNLKPGQRRPVILVSPILGGNMVVDHFARYYAGRGYIAALVHRKRILWDDQRKDIQQIEDYLRTSVIRLRQALDWILEQPEVDPNRVGAFGISYGAILHSVLAAVEPRIHYHVLAMPAAPLADVIINCHDKAIVKLVKKVHENYGWSREEIHKGLKETLRTDPIYLAAYVPRERVQLYIALFDRVVGVRRSFKLWRALNRPTLKMLPFGHYGGILVFPYLQTQSYLAFKWHLGK